MLPIIAGILNNFLNVGTTQRVQIYNFILNKIKKIKNSCYSIYLYYLCRNNLIIMKHLFKSLSEFQQVVPVIHKGTQGYGYSYADLPAIFEVINPLLKEHGLGFTQPIMGDTIKTVIFHIESGESIESLTEIPKNVTLKGMNDFQVLGSAITYLRRYALSSILGLVTDKDTDAGGQQQPKEFTPLPTLENERFKKALESIIEGKYTVEKLKAEYQLTELQTKALLLL